MQERQPVHSAKQTHFAFILQPEFPLAALILATDALRIANQNSGKDLFSWQFVSENAADMRASNGMWFAANCEEGGGGTRGGFVGTRFLNGFEASFLRRHDRDLFLNNFDARQLKDFYYKHATSKRKYDNLIVI